MRNDEVFALIKERVDGGGQALLTVTGRSMEPLFKDGRSAVRLVKPSFPLKKHDIALYLRENGAAVLHRAVKVRVNSCDFRGDNECRTEKQVPFGKIAAVVVSAETDGREVKLCGAKYRLYILLRVRGYMLRRAFRALRKRIYS